MIEKMLCKENDSLLDVMLIINENTMGMAFVINKEKKLIGTVTDGDIRRGLIENISLSDSILKVTNKKCIYGIENEPYNSLINKINEKVKVIPIVGKNNIVIDYFECKQSINFPVATPNLNGNEFKYLTDAFLSTWISSSGEYIDKFEKMFSTYSDCKYGITCANGTVALHLALVALDIGKGDEVIIPDLTFAATINAVIHAGATPVIVDIEEESWCIDPVKIEEAITKKTKAIIPVHLYGQSCDMANIMKIAKKHELKVIEDCAEAHGAIYNGKKVGSFGDIGCFSFFGNKVITTGEGGMCTTNNQVLDEKLRKLRDHGMCKSKRYWHDVVGYNYRLTNMQAAIGLAQLERIDQIHANRKKYNDSYQATLNNEVFYSQKNCKNRAKIVWLSSFLINKKYNRDQFLKNLKNKGVDARPFFYPLSDMDIYKKYSKKFTTITHKTSYLGINLPTYENTINIKPINKILLEAQNEMLKLL